MALAIKRTHNLPPDLMFPGITQQELSNTLSRFHRIPERNGRTDGLIDRQTYRQTDRQTDLLYQYRG